MHKIILYYNDTAGNYQLGDEKLTALLNDYGYHVIGAVPIEKGFKLRDNTQTDVIVIAGGDGSIRNVCLHLLNNNYQNETLAILPFGTANNIALHLGYHLKSSLSQICKKWDEKIVTHFDIGNCQIENESFPFVEGFGIGIFPALIRTMENMVYSPKILPSNEMKIAIKKLYKSMFHTDGIKCILRFNEKIVEDDFLLIETMNIRSLGPRWNIAPKANCEDGYFDLVYITLSQKPKLVSYLKLLAKGITPPFPFKSVRVKKMKIKVTAPLNAICHVDDQLIEINNSNELIISNEGNYFNFL